MKTVLKKLAEKKSGAPGYEHCPYCNKYHTSQMFNGEMCVGCAKRNDTQAMDSVMEEVNAKLDIIIEAINIKPKKASPKKPAKKDEPAPAAEPAKQPTDQDLFPETGPAE